MPRSSNAATSAFGWEFQSNVAIMLMLKNIDTASKVKVEGENEDVEITFSNGKILMAQAKAVENPDDFRNVKKKLKDGLRTLDAASRIADVEQLVYVTNSPNPFKDVATMYKFSSPLNMVPFPELPISCQQIINNLCSANEYNFDTSRLTVCVMQFHGANKDERYKVLQMLIRDLFNELKIHYVSVSQILSLWQNSFRENASQRNSVITKESMIWPIIAIQCEVRETDDELEDYDKSDITEILEKYQAIINNNSERFEFISKVLSDFDDFCPDMKSKKRIKRFIFERWEQYKNDFDLQTANSSTEEMIIRLALSAVLKRRKVIAEVKGKVKL